MNPNNVTFRKTENGDLEIAINPEGKTEIDEAVESGKNIHSDEFFTDLIEHQLCNGWQLIAPDVVGALTGALILTDDDVDSSTLTLYSNIANYQIESPVAIMLRDGCVVFQQAR